MAAKTRIGLGGPSMALLPFEAKTPFGGFPEQPCRRGQVWDAEKGECVGAGLDVAWNECAEGSGIKTAH